MLIEIQYSTNILFEDDFEVPQKNKHKLSLTKD